MSSRVSSTLDFAISTDNGFTVIGVKQSERKIDLGNPWSQEKKQLVFEGTVGQDAEALARLTEDDMRFLFA